MKHVPHPRFQPAHPRPRHGRQQAGPRGPWIAATAICRMSSSQALSSPGRPSARSGRIPRTAGPSASSTPRAICWRPSRSSWRDRPDRSRFPALTRLNPSGPDARASFEDPAMPFRMSLKKLIRREPASSLRERAASLQTDLARVIRQPTGPAVEPEDVSDARDADLLALQSEWEARAAAYTLAEP